MLKNYNNSIKVITEHLFTFLHSVCSFVEMARYLLSQKPGLFLLSERFNQDPLESFFGQQRARGGRSDNPNVATFCIMLRLFKFKEQWLLGMVGMCVNARSSGKQIFPTSAGHSENVPAKVFNMTLTNSNCERSELSGVFVRLIFQQSSLTTFRTRRHHCKKRSLSLIQVTAKLVFTVYLCTCHCSISSQP